MFRKIIKKVKSFVEEVSRIIVSPYRELTWPKKIIKTLIYLLIIAFILSIAALVLLMIAMTYIFGVAASALGPAIENGINEATGRNRRQRYYY